MARVRGSSFVESDRLDRRRVGETREVVAQAAVACELDGVGDEDGVGGGATGGGAASRENEGSGREVERPLEDEVAAAGHRVLLSRADRAILKEEHRLQGSARRHVERSHGATASGGAFGAGVGEKQQATTPAVTAIDVALMMELPPWPPPFRALSEFESSTTPHAAATAAPPFTFNARVAVRLSA